MELRRTVEALAGPIASSLGLELVQVDCVRTPGRWIVRIFVDRPEGGITLGECASVSRELGRAMDAGNVIESSYTLEVSSPGVNRPLTRPEHYARYLGDKVSIRTRGSIAGRRTFTGILEEVGNEGVTVALDDGERASLGFAEIAEAHLVVDPWKRPRSGPDRSGSLD
jgi:ribosome maturation factor RimP